MRALEVVDGCLGALVDDATCHCVRCMRPSLHRVGDRAIEVVVQVRHSDCVVGRSQVGKSGIRGMPCLSRCDVREVAYRHSTFVYAQVRRPHQQYA